jgi:hypothetical protein
MSASEEGFCHMGYFVISRRTLALRPRASSRTIEPGSPVSALSSPHVQPDLSCFIMRFPLESNERMVTGRLNRRRDARVSSSLGIVDVENGQQLSHLHDLVEFFAQMAEAHRGTLRFGAEMRSDQCA